MKMLKWFLKRINNKKGFTLVELVVVIAILGILSAIAVPKFTSSRAEAERAAHNANVKTIISAANMYIAQHGLPDDDKTYGKDEIGSLIQDWPKTPYKVHGVEKGEEYEVTVTSSGEITVIPDLDLDEEDGGAGGEGTGGGES
jgi:type IV pilus assembly protein PilA